MVRQSAKDRKKRLCIGACPVHGIDMPQIGLVGSGSDQLFLVKCPRRDCEIKGTTAKPNNPVRLLPEYAHLLLPPAC